MIRDVEFVGNTAIEDDELAKNMKGNRAQSLLSVLGGGGRYVESKFAEDAQSVEDHYRDHGYITARIGQPELRPLYDSADGTTRWVQLRVPVTEGVPYRIGTVALEGNQIVDAATLSRLFKLKEGEWYSQKAVREGLEKAREIYGAAGYMEFTGYPDLDPSDENTRDEDRVAGEPVLEGVAPTVKVTMRLSEGPRYTVNRISFTGNTTTRDNVIRREIQLVEGGVFNTEALKYSIRRLNQLGYFKPLEGNDKDLQVEKSADRENAVDVTLKFEEQNRNQISFGAGVSQYDGVFGSFSFTTANFMGRGESLTLSGQKGARSSNYQLAFTEPFLFDRPLNAGFNLFSTKVDYYTSTNTVGYSEVRQGAGVTLGRPLFRFSRVFLNYAYEVVDTAGSADFIGTLGTTTAAGGLALNPSLVQGHYIESRVSPSFVHNTVDSPFMPRQGVKVELNLPVAGGVLGGTTNYIRPEAETVIYIPHTRRTALGLRAKAGWIRPYGDTGELPYYLRFFLGGEYQIRGVDIRSVGPTDSQNRALGGNRFVLFNAEYYFDIGPVRALFFHDAGQAFGERERLDLTQLRTSSGAEARFVIPMLNVPFRLIYSWNIYRDVFQPARAFKFAVGTTF